MKDIKLLVGVSLFGVLIFTSTILYILFSETSESSFKVPGFERTFATGLFKGPVAMAYVPEQGRLYVSDPPSSSVFGFDLKGVLKATFGPREYNRKGFLLPGYIIAYEGNLLVSDPQQRQLYILDEKGNCEGEFIIEKMPISFTPGPMAAFPDGKVAVADNENGFLYIFHPDGRVKMRIGNSRERLFIRCGGMTICRETIFLTDFTKSEVIKISYLREVERFKVNIGDEATGFSTGLRCDGRLVYVTDALSSVVKCFSWNGALEGFFGNPPDAAKRLFLPVSIENIGDRFYVLEKGNKRISIWKKRN